MSYKCKTKPNPPWVLSVAHVVHARAVIWAQSYPMIYASLLQTNPHPPRIKSHDSDFIASSSSKPCHNFCWKNSYINSIFSIPICLDAKLLNKLHFFRCIDHYCFHLCLLLSIPFPLFIINLHGKSTSPHWRYCLMHWTLPNNLKQVSLNSSHIWCYPKMISNMLILVLFFYFYYTFISTFSSPL